LNHAKWNLLKLFTEGIIVVVYFPTDENIAIKCFDVCINKFREGKTPVSIGIRIVTAGKLDIRVQMMFGAP
jgi:hypothetical protein